MTVYEAAEKLGLEFAVKEQDRPYEDIFCCDLLSVAMARAPENGAWVTVIGNVNAVAVASLTDTACIVLAEGYSYDAAAIDAAKGKVSLLRSTKPVYHTAAALGALLG